MQRLSISTLVFLTASLNVCQHAVASNCIPDASVTLKAVTDNNGNDHIYWIDTNSLHLCRAGIPGAVDLTSSLNLPVAASPIVGAVNSTTPGEVSVFYVDGNNYIEYVGNDSTSSELTGLGHVAPWPGVAATYNSTTNVRSVTYAVPMDNSVDPYGVRNAVFRYDYQFDQRASSTVNLYSAYGRSIEHLETQVNAVDDGLGRVYSTFDPEGQGHIHYISQVGGTTGSLTHEDLMDDVSVGGMNVTSGGGIVAPNNPTCQASGIAAMSVNGNTTPRLLFIGKDGDLHLLSGQNTSWVKNDLTHDSGAPRPVGCGKIAATSYNSEYYFFESTVPPVGSGSGSGIFQITRPFNGGGSSYYSVITAYQGSGGGCQFSPIPNSPMTATANSTGPNIYYVSQTDAGNHLFRNCQQVF